MANNIKVKITGNFRSVSIKGADEKKHEKLYVFPQKFEVIDKEEELTSKVILRGKIFKKKVIMQSSQNKFILIFKLAIKRVNGKIDYIPCVAWNDIAEAISGMDIGAQIKVIGRIQSQEYFSKNPNDFDETITKTVFKLAVWKLYSEE